MAARVIAEALARAPGVEPAEIDDVILGCAMPEAEQGLNVARIASLRAGIPVTASAVTVNRFCSSGLQSIAYGRRADHGGLRRRHRRRRHRVDEPGADGRHKIAPNPALVDSYPDVYLTTGLVAENHAREAAVTREEQDAFALRSHQQRDRGDRRRAVPRRDRPLDVRTIAGGASATIAFDTDEGPRRDTSLEALAKLQAGVPRQGHRHGRQFVADERRRRGRRRHVGGRARALGLTPLARFVAFATAGVEPERFGIGPVPAIRKALEARRPDARPDRSRRAERGVRGPGASPACASCRSIRNG